MTCWPAIVTTVSLVAILAVVTVHGLSRTGRQMQRQDACAFGAIAVIGVGPLVGLALVWAI